MVYAINLTISDSLSHGFDIDSCKLHSLSVLLTSAVNSQLHACKVL
jgi:hypothetical protein